jgi:hypothetical protein
MNHGGDQRPSLGLISPSAREQGEHCPAQTERQKNDPTDDRLCRAPEHDESERQGGDEPSSHAPRDYQPM